MSLNAFRLSLLFCLLVVFSEISAQKPLNPIVDKGPKSKIELIKADSLIGTSGLNSLRTFYGHVRFFHRGVFLNCQKAIHNTGSNNLVAYGNILINQGDTLTITGDTLFYDGDTRIARIQGRKVILTDDDITLVSKKMNYDLNTDVAYYPIPGVINQDSVVLSSNKGYYNTTTKLFNYIGNVEILHPDFVLCTDTLDYDSNTKRADFNSYTTITSADGTLSANEGYYFTDSKKSKFFGRSFMENAEYTLTADTLDFDLEIEEGFGIGHVEFFSKADSLLLNGDYGEKLSSKGFTKISGNTLMRSVSDGDTLFLSAEYIIAYNSIDSVIQKPIDSLFVDTTKNTIDLSKTDTASNVQLEIIVPDSALLINKLPGDSLSAKPKDKNKIEFIIANGNVKIYRDDFQSICDSLNYNLIDSSIVFLGNPMIWSTDNQLEGDTIEVHMVNNKIKTMFLRQNSFVIAQDSAFNFNQIKGRGIVAAFDSLTNIQTVHVDGNGESIYFAMDDANKLIGLNRVECSRMVLNFLNRKVKRISFMGSPESRLIPPNEIGSNQIKLDDFSWEIEKKPTKKQVVGSYFADDIVEMELTPN
ncbi:MAG: hypothetical protein NXI00_13900 [Cytophagales bacterium]|nr:hypothetical protein [Cytophagales bacterium]